MELTPEQWANETALAALSRLNPSSARQCTRSVDFLDLSPAGSSRFATCPTCVFTTASGVRIVYQYSHGAKTPLVILGGGTTGRKEACTTYGAEEQHFSSNAVLIFDRRNTGSSDVNYAGFTTELKAQVSDVAELLEHLQLPRVILYGHSSGARLLGMLANNRPDLVTAVALCSLTGGRKAARELARQYYTAHANAAESEGMELVLARPTFARCSQRNGRVAPYLRALPVDEFLRVMRASAAAFLETQDEPALCLRAADLARLRVPALLLNKKPQPGDGMHTEEATRAVAAVLPLSEPPVVSTKPAVWATALRSFVERHSVATASSCM